MHPGEDLLDFNEPKKANFNMGGKSFGYPPNISHQWIPPETHLPNEPLGSVCFLGRVKVEIMFFGSFFGT